MTSDIDPKKVGDAQTVRVSSMNAFAGIKLHDKLIRDYGICKKYFGGYILHAMDATPFRGAPSAVEPAVRGEMLTREHCADPSVRAQLNEILEMNARMMQDGHPSIDLVGHDGVITGRLSNIIVGEDKKLHIIDATLLEGKSIRPIGYLLEILLPVIRLRQTLIIRRMRRQKDGAR